MLPVAVKKRLAAHLLTVKRQHEGDLTRGEGRVVLPFALDRKYPGAPTEWGWQFVFPASRICRDPKWGPPSRFHLHESVVQKAVTQAVRRAGLTKHASCHTFCHSFATAPRGWLRHPNRAGVPWACAVRSIGCDHRAVVIGRAPCSQTRTNLLMAEIAKSLRQRHWSSRILSASSAWLTATTAANPLGAVNHDRR